MTLDNYYGRKEGWIPSKELRLIRFLLPELKKLPEANEPGSRLWEILQFAKIVDKYPIEDSQFKNRLWTEDWKEFIDADIWDARIYYKFTDIEPLKKGEPDYTLISKEQIACQLEIIGVKLIDDVYSINLELFPPDLLEFLNDLETFEERQNFFGIIAIRQYQKFLDEQKELGNL